MTRPGLTYFTPGEFGCKCGACTKGFRNMSMDLLDRLDRARNLVGFRWIITSGMRCAEYNQQVGGSPTSSHLTGFAVDIAVDSSRKRFETITALISQGLTRIGIHRDFIHVDSDPSKAGEVIWLY